MGRIASALLAVLAATSVHGASLPALISRPADTYVFDQPRILVEQRLFGLAHGISLLAHACYAHPRYAEPVRNAYAAWHERQFATIDRARRELSGFYFGVHAGEASWTEIVAAIGLKSEIALKPGTQKYNAACATLPEALGNYRNDLAAQFRLQGDLTRVAIGAVTIAHADACLAQLNGDSAALRARIDAWHQQHDAVIALARQGLESQWKAAGLDGSIEHLLLQARSEGAKQARQADCQAVAGWLATPAADPDAAFSLKGP